MPNLPLGTGSTNSIALGSPTVGNNFLYLPVDNTRHRVLAIIFSLVTDATVINRIPAFTIVLGGRTWRFTSDAVVPASTIISLWWLAGYAGPLGQQNLDYYHSFPVDFTGDQIGPITSTIVNLQAGDTVSSPYMLAEEWIVL